MPAHRRLMLAAACLALGLAAHAALAWHLAPVTARPPADLRAPLDSFPEQLAIPGGPTWTGKQTAGLETFRDSPPYPIDDLLWRDYRAAGHAPVSLFLVYSHTGEDRNHHPEICIREVAGAREDLSARGIVPLGGDPNRPVQRFRFVTGAVRRITVYYWHYALDSEVPSGSSWLQRIHARASRPMPSLTAQVTLAGGEAQEQDAEGTFLVQVDAALRRGLLPAGARMACDRKPVILLGK